MGGIRETYRKLKKAKRLLPETSAEAIEKTSDDWMDLNKSQLLEGQDSKGEMLGRYKPPFGRYARMKHELNPLPGIGNKDYKLKGNYYKGMYLKIEGGKVVQSSTDEKTKWLEKQNDKRYGLQPQNREKYKGVLRPVFNNLFLQKLK